MGKSYDCEVYENNVPDSTVWKWLSAGDVRALKTLYLRYHKYLYYYASKLSGNQMLAEDCVQDLFFRLWNQKENLGTVHSVKSYLWVSLRRDIVRAKNDHLNEILTDDIAKFSPQIYFTQNDFVINSKRKSASSKTLTNALNQLPSRQKEAILLKYFNGMGYDEIEMIMNINYQTARNYVSSGVQNLKIVLKGKSESSISYIFSV